MTTLTLTERIEDMTKINYLNQMTYGQFTELFKKKEKTEDDMKKDETELCKKKEKTEDDMKKDYTKLKSYCSSVIFNKGTNTREYKYSKETPVNIGGRLYGGGVQGLPKKIRGF